MSRYSRLFLKPKDSNSPTNHHARPPPNVPSSLTGSPETTGESRKLSSVEPFSSSAATYSSSGSNDVWNLNNGRSFWYGYGDTPLPTPSATPHGQKRSRQPIPTSMRAGASTSAAAPAHTPHPYSNTLHMNMSGQPYSDSPPPQPQRVFLHPATPFPEPPMPVPKTPPTEHRAWSIPRISLWSNPTNGQHARPFSIALVSLPIPPVLCATWTVMGHAIMRGCGTGSHDGKITSPDGFEEIPLVASLRAGLAGGAILILPLLLLAYLIITHTNLPQLRLPAFSSSTPPSSPRLRVIAPSRPDERNAWRVHPASNPAHDKERQRQQSQHPDDFFDDESTTSKAFKLTNLFSFRRHGEQEGLGTAGVRGVPSNASKVPWMLVYALILAILSILIIGGAGAALGVACLRPYQPSQTATDESIRMLTANEAARSGLLGAVVFWCGIALVLALVSLVVRMRSSRGSGGGAMY